MNNILFIWNVKTVIDSYVIDIDDLLMHKLSKSDEFFNDSLSDIFVENSNINSQSFKIRMKDYTHSTEQTLIIQVADRSHEMF